MAAAKKKKGGFTRKAIKNNANMQVVRDSNSEFSMCSIFLKEFKIALLPILCHYRVGSLHQGLMQLFLKIKALDRDSPAGALHVSGGLRTKKGQLLLREFTFTPKVGIRQFFGNPVIDQDDFTVSWEDFKPSQARFPKAATHLEILYLVLTYQRDRKQFLTVSSAPIRRAKIAETEHLKLQLTKPVARGPELQHILVMSLRFMEVIGEEEYPLLGKDSLGIEVLEVFG